MRNEKYINTTSNEVKRGSFLIFATNFKTPNGADGVRPSV